VAYASQAGRARTSPKNPQAHAICDRCGTRYNHVNLSWQHDWRGATLQNTRILVCRNCLDVPQEQQRAIVVPADPTPIIQARLEDFAGAETDYRTAAAPPTIDPKTGLPVYSSVQIVTPAGQNMTTQPIGAPSGTTHSPSMPAFGEGKYFPLLTILSINGNGLNTVTVTCRTPHGLVNDNQVTIEGVAGSNANGTYSVTAVTATAFTYSSSKSIPSGSLLLGNTIVYRVSIGLPLNYSQQPQTGT